MDKKLVYAVPDEPTVEQHFREEPALITAGIGSWNFGHILWLGNRAAKVADVKQTVSFYCGI